ncbi:acyltransferase family protein [Paenochrobactrum pullorum]|uniref:acyltransferase family protein n=1 Tax=Paenochrobactrum pullorum TaxID=1324351 RepID=UPI0035BBB295
MQRNDSADTLKAILILFVVVGHFFIEPVKNNEIKRAIYVFHMPLFLGLSGYLFSFKAPNDYFSAIKTRFFVPWVIATTVYFAYFFIVHEQLKFNMVNAFIKPWFHLWFVPCLIAYSLFACTLRNQNISLLLIAGVIPYITRALDYDILKLIGPVDSRFVYYAIFFFIGVAIRQYSHLINRLSSIVITLLAVTACIVTFKLNLSNNQLGTLRMLLVVGVIGMVANFPSFKTKIGNSILSRESLSIYLYHVILILILREFLSSKTWEYWIACYVLTLLLLPFTVKIIRTTKVGNLILGRNKR